MRDRTRRRNWIAGWPALALICLAGPGLLRAARTYVGTETCAQCHSDNAKWLAGSVHATAVLKTKDGKKITGCETCHGPGSAHIEDLTPKTILTFRNEPAAQRSAACLRCHASIDARLNFRSGDHDRRKVACDQCHTVTGSQAFHAMRAVGDVMGRAEPALCYRCHAEKRASFALPYHHPVKEGFMRCTSCHEPHGTFTRHQLRTRNNEPVCGKCHEDLEGPFIFEHPAGRASGCQTCHLPHGSTNPKLLTRFRVQFLCLECHADTPPSHNLARQTYQNCTACHSRIHGSNLDRLFFR